MSETILENAWPDIDGNSIYGTVVNVLNESSRRYPELILWDAGTYPNVHLGRTPTNRRPRQSDLISIELHPKYTGDLGHGERCISLAKPKEEFEGMQQVSRRAYDSGYELLRAQML